MMFKCQLTGKLSQPGEKAVRIVTKTRQRIYTRENPKTKETEIIGKGWEIVQEKLVLQATADKIAKEGKL